jgi:peroxiredoxin
LGALQSRYGAEGLSVIGVTSDAPDEVVPFARRAGVSYPLLTDASGDTTRNYGVSTLPTLVVIDKRGTVRDVSVGYDPGEERRLEQVVVSLLGEHAN